MGHRAGATSRRARGTAAVVATAAAMLALAACTSSTGSTAAVGSAARGSAAAPTTSDAGSAAPTSTPTPVPEPTLDVPDTVPFDHTVRLAVSDGTLVSAKVTTQGGSRLAGAPASDGSGWVSAKRPVPGESYRISATLADADGARSTVTAGFTVAKVPDSRRLTLATVPTDGMTVGIGAPVVVRFDQRVTERAAVERGMHIASSPRVPGTWHWLGSREVHFRPKQPWPAGTKVAVHLDLNGVKAGSDLWGGRSYDVAFNVGRARTSVVDARAHTMTVREGGSVVGVWPTSLGRPEFATRNGTYVVLGKDSLINMTSCSVGITCDKKDPNYYDLPVKWDVRLTNSGTFVHAAPWSLGSQGNSNVSHGCINLSESHGRAFYDMSSYGDLVTVRGSTRAAADLVNSGDPGMADWNISWSAYAAGSALGGPIRTESLGASTT